MAKKKTRVTLPGSLSDLVRDLQNGKPAQEMPIETVNEEEPAVNQQYTENDERQPEAVQKTVERAESGVSQLQPDGSQQSGVGGQEIANRPIGNAAEGSRAYSPGRPVKQNTMKEYHIVKDDSKDSWDLFLDMAKQYKDGGGKLATIYIDGTLKNILDRMKYVGEVKLPTSAILSSIVARFIYDHEDEIRKALFSGNLF